MSQLRSIGTPLPRQAKSAAHILCDRIFPYRFVLDRRHPGYPGHRLRYISTAPRMIIMPSQNDGIAIPAIANVLERHSLSHVSCLMAEIAPKWDCRSQLATNVAIMATCSDKFKAQPDLIRDRLTSPHRLTIVEREEARS